MKKTSFEEKEFPFSIPPADGTEILSAKVDFTFKKLFGSEENIHILAAFLQSILSIPKEEYGEITLKNPTLQKDFAFSKYGVLDVLLTTKSGTTINVEIQLLSKSNYKNRILYYLSSLLNSQIQVGSDYITIPKIISISVLNFELINDSINYKHVFHLYDKKLGVDFTDLIEVITLELPKLPEIDTGDEALPWLKFIKAEGKEETMTVVEKYPHLQEVYSKLQAMSIKQEDIYEYNLRLRAFYDEVSDLNEKERIRTALEQGKKELKRTNTELLNSKIELEKASTELEKTSTELEKTSTELEKTKFQLVNALEQGANTNALATAKKLIAMGDSIDKIVAVTGLSEELVRGIK